MPSKNKKTKYAPCKAELSATPGSAYREYLACLLYESDSVQGGYVPCRWGTLRADLKEKWLAEADAKTTEWLADEEAARKRRDADDPRAFFQ